MASPTVIETVFWEDDRTRTRDVVGRCQTCARMHPTLPLTPASLVQVLVADPSSFNADADDREHWDETDEVGW